MHVHVLAWQVVAGNPARVIKTNEAIHEDGTIFKPSRAGR